MKKIIKSKQQKIVTKAPVKKQIISSGVQNKTSTTKSPLIQGSDLLYVLFKKHPEIKYILLKHTIYCGVYTHYDTLEGRAKAHGLTTQQLTALLKDINAQVASKN